MAEMVMTRAGGGGEYFVVLEGPEDLCFWRSRLRVDPRAIVIAEGVSNLRECMRALPPQLEDSVCAIADSDFKKFLNVDDFAGCRNTFFYDEGFLETFLLNSAALGKVLGLHGDSGKIRSFCEANRPLTVYAALRQMGGMFGRLRVVNQVNGWGVCFARKFTPYRYIDEVNWALNEAALMEDFSVAVGVPVAEIERQCDSVGFRREPSLLHGHDSLKLLAIGLRSRLGAVNISPDRLRQDLCLAFESAGLQRKRLTRQLIQWGGARRLL